MEKYPFESLCTPYVFRGELTFDNRQLSGLRWPLWEMTGREAGPRLCVMAGVHPNEVSSIEAAIRLQSCFVPETLRGSVSILPIVNLPALYYHTEYNCPVDGKNINFTFPGDPEGSFTEALCHALLFEWAEDAVLHVDLHGGDLRERVAKFVMYQRTGERTGDTFREKCARCFDADLVVGFEPTCMDQPGRALTALAKVGRNGVMSEAGANGIVDELSVRYHMDGVLNLTRYLGMVDGPLAPHVRGQVLCQDYAWVKSPADGFLRVFVEPGQYVIAKQLLGIVRDHFGRETGQVIAPTSGYVLWRMTHPVLCAGDSVLGLAIPAE